MVVYPLLGEVQAAVEDARYLPIFHEFCSSWFPCVFLSLVEP